MTMTEDLTENVTEDQRRELPFGAQRPVRQPGSAARDAINEMIDAGLLDEVRS